MIHALILIAVQVAHGTVIDATPSPNAVGSTAIAAAPEIDAFLSVHLAGPAASRHLSTVLLHAGAGVSVVPDVAANPGGSIAALTPAVAWNPQSRLFLVTWADSAGGTYMINGRLVSETGALQGSVFTIYSSSTILRVPNLASDGLGWFVTWAFAPIPTSGPTITTLPMPAADDAAVAPAGGGIDITIEPTPSGISQVQGSLVTVASGVPGAGTMTSLYATTAGTGDVTPDVAALGSGGYVVAWRQLNTTICARTVSSTGVPGATTNSVFSNAAGFYSAPSLATDSITGLVTAAIASTSKIVLVRKINAAGAVTGSQGSYTTPATSILASSGVSLVHVPAVHEFVLSYFVTGPILELARFNGPDLSSLGRLTPAPLSTPALATADPTVTTAARATAPGLVAQFTTATASIPAFEAMICDVGANPNGPVVNPLASAQNLLDGTAVTTGGGLPDRHIVLSSATDPHPGSFALQFEVKTLSSAFDGQGTVFVAGLPAGSTGQVTIDLAPGTSYHWRVRSIDAAQIPSLWASFGGNAESAADFVSPVNSLPVTAGAGQGSAASGETVAVGYTEGASRGIRFATLVDDADGDMVRLDVEVRLVGTAFSDEATASSGYVAPGATAVIELGGLEGDYHWQSRVVDSVSGASPWTSFGGNAEGDADFRILPFGSMGVAGGCAQSSGGGAAALVLIAAGLLLLTLRPAI